MVKVGEWQYVLSQMRGHPSSNFTVFPYLELTVALGTAFGLPGVSVSL
jgi:hypothetical protein